MQLGLASTPLPSPRQEGSSAMDTMTFEVSNLLGQRRLLRLSFTSTLAEFRAQCRRAYNFGSCPLIIVHLGRILSEASDGCQLKQLGFQQDALIHVFEKVDKAWEEPGARGCVHIRRGAGPRAEDSALAVVANRIEKLERRLGDLENLQGQSVSALTENSVPPSSISSDVKTECPGSDSLMENSALPSSIASVSVKAESPSSGAGLLRAQQQQAYLLMNVGGNKREPWPSQQFCV